MTPLSTRNPQAFGLIVTVLGVLVFVPDALVVRLIGADTMTVGVWRGAAAFATTAIGLALFGRHLWAGWRAMVRPAALLMMLWQGTGSVLFLGALGSTSVANTLLISAAAPFIAALLGWLVLREAPDRSTIFAMIAVFAGVAVIGGGSVGAGRWLGDVLALMNAFTNAAYYVTIRKAPDQPLILPIALGYLVTSALCLGFAPSLQIDATQAGLIFISGGVILAGGVALLVIGPRYLPAAEVTMLTMLEIVLGPIVVWAVLGEMPAEASLIGGAIILAAILAHAGVKLKAALPARA